jgi:hypothetical protein
MRMPNALGEFTREELAKIVALERLVADHFRSGAGHPYAFDGQSTWASEFSHRVRAEVLMRARHAGWKVLLTGGGGFTVQMP